MREGLHGLVSRLGHVALDMFGVEGCVRAALRRACPRRLRRARVACRLRVALPRAWPRRRPVQPALGRDLLCRHRRGVGRAPGRGPGRGRVASAACGRGAGRGPGRRVHGRRGAQGRMTGQMGP